MSWPDLPKPVKTWDLLQTSLRYEQIVAGRSRNKLELPWPFHVHASIIKKLEKRLNEIFQIGDWEMYEKKLQFGDKWFNMYEIFILRGDEEQLDNLEDLISLSQYSFPLEENPTLFIDARSVNVMEKFIRDHQLKPFIIKREEMIGVSLKDVKIIVITFDKNVNKKLNLIEEFYYKVGNSIKYLYMKLSFRWERLPILRKGHINDELCLVFPIILQHLGTINYKNELNLMDLISLRLAIYDVRDPLQANSIKSEIDYLLKRILAKYVTNGIFNLHQYIVDTNCENNELFCKYLIYEFQDYFKYVNYDYRIDSTKVRDQIKLKSESDALNKIKDKFNVQYIIDGRDFDRMSSSLFHALLQCKNVTHIELDTNYRWIKDEPKIVIPYYKRRDHFYIMFYGENRAKFADDCLAELKRFEYDQIKLELHCSLDDYRILDNLKVYEIEFFGIRIDTNMLEQLQQCNIKSPLFVYSCSIENSLQTWELLTSIEKLWVIEITEDEGTWETIFEFVVKQLHSTNSNEFQFKKDIWVCSETERKIYLESFKFTIDEQMSKLEIRKAKSKDLVDLFYYKRKIKPDENFDFEFYQ